MPAGADRYRASPDAGPDGYLERLVDPWIAEILASVPAVMITGARATGKTTTALRHAAAAVCLDNEAACLHRERECR